MLNTAEMLVWSTARAECQAGYAPTVWLAGISFQLISVIFQFQTTE